MSHRLSFLLVCLLSASLAAAQSPPVLTGGMTAPIDLIFTPQKNLLVAEAGTMSANSGRISLVSRATGARKSLIEGLPSGVNRIGGEAGPAGPSGLALSGDSLYVTIGQGDAALPGPGAGLEVPNPQPSSPILSSVLELTMSRPVDMTSGGFALLPSDHAALKAGQTLSLTNGSGESLTVRLVVDFPDTIPNPRGDAPDNVRVSNPFGVVSHGPHLFVVDASHNNIRRVNKSDGSVEVITSFPPLQNPLPFGPPVMDAVPDSIRLAGDRLLVTFLTGFPFPPGGSMVRSIPLGGGLGDVLIPGLTTAIDVIPVGAGRHAVLEFSTNMTEGAPGRLRLMGSGDPVVLAQPLISPTSLAFDPVTSEFFVTQTFPGTIVRINASQQIGPAPAAFTIPVAGSAHGINASSFTTAATLSNPHPFSIAGQMLFRPADGSPAIATDYQLAPFSSLSWQDLASSMRTTGLGSIDLIPIVGPAPASRFRVLSTTPSGHAVASALPLVTSSEVLLAGDVATLMIAGMAPSHRFNGGVRAFAEGATLRFVGYDQAGNVVGDKTAAFFPSTVTQAPLSTLLGFEGARMVRVEVVSGSAIVYSSAVLNASNDSTIEVATRLQE